MKRILAYPASIPRAADILNTNRNTMIALGMLAQEMLGTSTVASGFACTPTAPTSLNVSVAGGRLYSLQAVDPLQYSTLPADTTDLIVKQGILLATSTLSCPAAAISGQSINYLIEAAFQEVDSDPLVLPYYNAANPAQAWSGPSNSGDANYTSRDATVQLQVKAGTPATTGTQTTPAPDSGFVGLWVVTVAFGQTTITTGNISQYSGAPLIGGSLLKAVQNNSFTYAADSGVANAYAANYSPALTALSDGMTVEFEASHANTGASTFAPNGITAAPIVGGAHSALQGGEIASGSKCVLMWKSNISSWVLLESSGGALQISPATKSNHAVNLGMFAALLSGNGYFEVPAVVGGVQRTVIVQWGSVGVVSSGSGITTQTFSLPIAYTNTHLFAMASFGGTAPPTQGAPSAVPFSTSQVEIALYTATSGTYAANYISIGY